MSSSSRKKSPAKSGKSSKKKASIERAYSSLMLDGPSRAASRAMLYPVGFSDKDFSKSIVRNASQTKGCFATGCGKR